jgi:hypothetical protein
VDEIKTKKESGPKGTGRRQKLKNKMHWTPEIIREAKNIYDSTYRKYSKAGIHKSQVQVYNEVAQKIGYTKGNSPGGALRTAIKRFDAKKARKRGAKRN